MPKSRRRPVVIICGPAGSGKSTVATLVAKRFKLTHVSAGDQFRKVAKERGMNLIDLGRYAAKHPDFDKELDHRVMSQAKKGGAVLDGRAAAYLARKMRIPALKIYLSVDPKVSAKRVSKRDGITVPQALATSRLREKEIAKRLKTLYGLDTSSTAYYDAVIQTDLYRPEEVLELIASLVTYERH
jgi:cytidylate kinase